MGDDTIGDFDELNNEARLDGFTGIGNDAQALATASGGGTVPITLDFGAQGTLTSRSSVLPHWSVGQMCKARCLFQVQVR